MEPKTFYKDIIGIGFYDADGKDFDVTEERMQSWIENTKRAKMQVWIPYGYHTDDPTRNVGWVDVDSLKIVNGELWGNLQILDADAADAMEAGRVKEVSIGIAKDYTTEGGEVIGEIIEHVAVVLNPIVKGQGDFVPLNTPDISAKRYSELIHFSNKNKVKEGETVMKEITEPDGLTDEGKTLWKAFTGLVTGIFTDFGELKKALADLNAKVKVDDDETETKLEPDLDADPVIEALKTDSEKALAMAKKAIDGNEEIRLEKRLASLAEVIELKDMADKAKAVLINTCAFALKSGEEKAIEKIEASIADLPDDPRTDRIFLKHGATLGTTGLAVEEVEKYMAKHEVSYTKAYELLSAEAVN